MRWQSHSGWVTHDHDPCFSREWAWMSCHEEGGNVPTVVIARKSPELVSWIVRKRVKEKAMSRAPIERAA
jgi:hypothetical protein